MKNNKNKHLLIQQLSIFEANTVLAIIWSWYNPVFLFTQESTARIGLGILFYDLCF